jgi:hypothetical protein
VIFRFSKFAAGTYPSAAIERLVNSKPKVERYKLKNKLINKAAFELIKAEKSEGRRRRKRKKKHGLDRKATVKNNAGRVVTSNSDIMAIEEAGEGRDTSTSVSEAAEVCCDAIMANDYAQKEAASNIATENKTEVQKASKEEIEENHSENSGAVSRLKRKCGLLLTDSENLDVGIQQPKMRRKESPRTLKVAKDKKNRECKNELVCNITSEPSTSRSRMSVGGDWEVSDVTESDMEVRIMTSVL